MITVALTETEVAGARIRVPMMSIHTVAAGGGSVLKFEDERFQVGPGSAGADPGPACYRRGGPLTVTDCNLLLGKLQADQFPSVFGPQGDAPLDREVVVRKFGDLANQVNKSPEETAEGGTGTRSNAGEERARALRAASERVGKDFLVATTAPIPEPTLFARTSPMLEYRHGRTS